MGLTQEAQATVTRYEDGVRATIGALHDLAATVEALLERLAAHGPLGATSDPDVSRARTRLAAARHGLLAACDEAVASSGQARGYVDRAFPS